jgi:hypothetical protein
LVSWWAFGGRLKPSFFQVIFQQDDKLGMKASITQYKSSAWYFRKALRESKTKKEAVEVGMLVVLELESLKAWVRERGAIPPKRFVLAAEAQAKHWSVARLVPAGSPHQ